MQKAQLEEHLKAVDRDGYTVLEGAIEPELNAAILGRVRELREGDPGRARAWYLGRR